MIAQTNGISAALPRRTSSAHATNSASVRSLAGSVSMGGFYETVRR